MSWNGSKSQRGGLNADAAPTNLQPMRASDLAEHHHNLGGAHKIAGRLKEAEAEFRRALELDPTRATTKYALGVVLLGLGNYSEGWILYEYRHQVPEFRNLKPKLPVPEWYGEDVKGKSIVIWPEQGFGDQIQFARFAPVLRDLGASVTLFCSPALKRLFDLLDVNVIAASGAVEFPDPDGWVMCGSVAGRLGITPSNIPSTPYLRMPRAENSAKAKRIGLMPRGNPHHPNDVNRSLSAAMAERLASLPGTTLSIHPEDTGCKDFKETAEIISGLDLVISVDTAVAHLAGAMGVECWTLLPTPNTDWRWIEGRDDTPWYPSMRLFRQAPTGDWSSTIEHIESALVVRT